MRNYVEKKIENEVLPDAVVHDVLMEEMLKNEKLVYRSLFKDLYFKKFITNLGYVGDTDIHKRGWVEYLTALSLNTNISLGGKVYTNFENRDSSYSTDVLRNS